MVLKFPWVCCNFLDFFFNVTLNGGAATGLGDLPCSHTSVPTPLCGSITVAVGGFVSLNPRPQLTAKWTVACSPAVRNTWLGGTEGTGGTQVWEGHFWALHCGLHIPESHLTPAAKRTSLEKKTQHDHTCLPGKGFSEWVLPATIYTGAASTRKRGTYSS